MLQMCAFLKVQFKNGVRIRDGMILSDMMQPGIQWNLDSKFTNYSTIEYSITRSREKKKLVALINDL